MAARLHDEDLLIRSATDADAEQLTAWWNSGEVMAHAGFPHGLGQSVDATRAHIARSANSRDERLIIEEADVLIGETNYRFVEPNVAEIGIKICEPTAQDRGLGSRALRLLITHLFADIGVTRIVLDTTVENRRAQHTYEKLGFRNLGVTENAWTDQLGVRRSRVDYEMTADDWRAQ